MIFVLAIMGMIASSVIFNASSIIDSYSSTSIKTLLQKSVKESRYHALISKQNTFLRFDTEQQQFLILSENGEVLSKIPEEIDPDSPPNNPAKLFFHAIITPQGLQPNTYMEYHDKKMDQIRFGSNGVSQRFLVAIEQGPVNEKIYFDPPSGIRIDKWTELKGKFIKKTY